MKLDYIELPHIWYDVSRLKAILDTIPNYNWYTFGCNNIRWTVKEEIKKYRLECKNVLPNDFFEELFIFFDGNLSYDRLLFSKTPPPGVPKHIDRTRHTIINFPILGKFTTSPQSFWTSFEDIQPKSQFFYNTENSKNCLYPFAFNGQTIHSVENTDDIERTILSIWFDLPFENFKTEFDFTTKLINKNFNGKYFKMIS